ncbi:MAG TPA: CoA transferase [Frankiaceae bacterium]|nr:CoA transferase [Frankiaceae bacterium]
MSYDLLEGVRVVELSMYALVPSAAAVLADWGADVVKVVPVKVADPMLGNPIAGLPKKDVGVAFMWELLNRGKRCMGLDVSTPEGRQILLDLVSQADVFITNLLPGARARFRIDPDDLSAANPALIYGRASGHGADGPERDAGGFDHTDFWARTGIAHAASMVAGEFIPQPGPALGDLAGGGFLAGAIAAALYRRTRTGQGSIVDVSLLSSGMWVGAPAVIASQLYGVDTIPRMSHLKLPNPLVAAYTTRDGRQIYLAGIMTEGHYENFCETIERKDLLEDPRFATGAERLAHARECIDLLDELFASRDLAEWVVLLAGLTTPWTVVQTAAEAANDPQVVANGFVASVEGRYPLVRSPAQFDGLRPDLERAPQHGEHTEEVLLELGRSWDDIAALKAAEAIS